MMSTQRNTLILVTILSAAAAAAGCSAPTGDPHAGEGLPPAGKADTGSVQADTPLADAILKLANEASAEVLRDEVGIGARATENIVAYRKGDDRQAGTEDDGVFDTLEELDAVPFMYPEEFERMRDHVESEGTLLSCTNPGEVEVSGSAPLEGRVKGLFVRGERIYVGAAGLRSFQIEEGKPVQQDHYRVGELEDVWLNDHHAFLLSVSGFAIVKLEEDGSLTELSFTEKEGLDHIAASGDRLFVGHLDQVLGYDIADPTRPRSLGEYEAPDFLESLAALDGRAVLTHAFTTGFGKAELVEFDDRDGARLLDTRDRVPADELSVDGGRILAFSTIEQQGKVYTVDNDSFVREVTIRSLDGLKASISGDIVTGASGGSTRARIEWHQIVDGQSEYQGTVDWPGFFSSIGGTGGLGAVWSDGTRALLAAGGELHAGRLCPWE
jgi:hypothetical protein